MNAILLALAIFGTINARSIKERGVPRDDEWFNPLRDLATEVIVSHFHLEGIRDLVKQSVEECIIQEDTTNCLVGKVDTLSAALGNGVPQTVRDDARIKVGGLAAFLKAVHGACSKKSGEEIGKCAWEQGQLFCQNSKFASADCMEGVTFVLEKVKQLAGGRKRGISRDDKWFTPLRDLATEIIVTHFKIARVRDLVQQSVEECMLLEDTINCFVRKVDTVSDALGNNVPQTVRDDARVKVAALGEFITAVHGACSKKSGEEIGKCALEQSQLFCQNSPFGQAKCMEGVNYIIEKVKQMAGAKKRGL